MILRALLIAAFVSLLIAAALADGPIGSRTTITPIVTEPVQVEEDELGWGCRTMGNRSCGPEGEPEVSRR
ncbi:hypothetical protein ACH347_29995 [Saccharopolyspora sp. 5N102]|uniref:hypothetical protein n=1 Tax=Saccharopolyspora sp. 5N102 TaxID=3375155 RepID=UPI0037B68ECD